MSFRNRQNSELFRPVSQRVQMNFIFNDNVRIFCLSCNVKKVGKLVRFKQNHAHLQAVYYNCVKFHLNPMSRLGGVALTSRSLHT
jgi:hypothetical protein